MVTLLMRNLWRKLRGMSAFTTVIVRISKTNKKSNSWEKIGEKFNLSCLFMNIFRIQNDVSFGFEADVVVALGLKEEINLLAAKFPPRCPPYCLLWFSREHNARVHLTFPLNETYGYSRICDALRSSAIIWKQLSLQSSAIVCDHMETSLYCLTNGQLAPA